MKVDWSGLQYFPEAEDFIDTFDFPKELVEAVARYPQSRETDPRSQEVGYPIVRCKRGDITVVLGLRDFSHPMILYVRLHTPEEHTRNQRGSKSGSQGQSSIPTSQKGLLSWLQKQGCRVQYNGRGHHNVYLGETLLGAVSSTPHSRGTKNDFTWIRKRLAAEKAKQALMDHYTEGLDA